MLRIVLVFLMAREENTLWNFLFLNIPMKAKHFMASAFAFAIVGSAQAMTTNGFVDVDANTKFGAAIEYIQDLGLVQGYSDGTYRPDSTINRYDFTKIIVGARFDAETIANCDVSMYTFPDVPTDQWFSPYVCTAKQYGIVNGYGDGTFGGQNNVSHPEALKIVLETFEIPVTEEAGDTWYDPYLRAAAANSINTALPADVNYVITRGDMAELVMKTEAVSEIKISKMMDSSDTMEEDTMEDDTAADAETRNIVQIASETEDLSTLVAAVTAAELAGTLTANGPFTVFAPLNSAFAALPEGTVDTLLMPENKTDLVDILTYHVASGAVMSGDLSDGQEITVANGGTLVVSIGEDGSVMINDAKVVTADIPAVNGVIHVIDAVLIPTTPEEDEMMDEEEMTDEGDEFSYTDYSAEAVAAAQADGKVTALFFHAPWCPDCVAIDEAITSNLADFPENTVIFKVDYDTNVELRQENEITTQSTLVYFDAEGSESGRATNPSLEEIIAALQ